VTTRQFPPAAESPQRGSGGGACVGSAARAWWLSSPKDFGHKVRKFTVLPVAPHILHRIELGRVPGRDSSVIRPRWRGRTPGRRGCDERGDRPDDEQLAAQMALKVTEELDDLCL